MPDTCNPVSVANDDTDPECSPCVADRETTVSPASDDSPADDTAPNELIQIGPLDV